MSPRRPDIRSTVFAAMAAMTLTSSVIWRALGGFFYSDDLIHLQQAAGLLPTQAIPWRLPSQVGYFRAMLAAFGPNPIPFLVANVAFHLACVAGVVVIARRLGATAAGAALAGTLFGACPLFLPVLMRAVAVNEWMSGIAWIATFLLATRASRPRMVGATAAFVFGVLAKESIVALPPVLFAARPVGERWVDAARRLRPLLLAMALALAGYGASRAIGLAPAGAFYALGPAAAPVQLATYTSWALTWSDPLPDRVRVPDPAALVPGLAILFAIAVFGLGRGDAARRVRIGLSWWILGLAPVLVLERSTYGHYAYVPLAGLALAVAAVAERALGAFAAFTRPGVARERNGADARAADATAPYTPANAFESTQRPAWARRAAAVALVLAAVTYTANADGLMLRRLAAVTADGAWPLDATMRGVEAIRRSVTSLTTTLQPDDHRVAIFGLSALGTRYGARSGRVYASVARPAYDLLAASLDGGRALRLFAPQLESVVFVTDSLPKDTTTTLYVRDAGEWLQRMGRGAAGRARVERWIERESGGPPSDGAPRSGVADVPG